MGIEKCLAERDEEKMSKGEKSSLRVDKGKEKEISEEARAKSYFSQRSYWFDDQRPRSQECGRRHMRTYKHDIIYFKCGLDITR